MAVLQGSVKETIQKKLEEDVVGNIKLVMFTQEMECHFCADTRQLVEELVLLSQKIEAEIHDFVKDEKLARQYGIKKIPAIAMLGDKDFGVRFYGIPSGYELMSFIEDIIDVSRGGTDLPEDIKKKLAQINKKIHNT